MVPSTFARSLSEKPFYESNIYRLSFNTNRIQKYEHYLPILFILSIDHAISYENEINFELLNYIYQSTYKKTFSYIIEIDTIRLIPL